jgi:hypothetical protein
VPLKLQGASDVCTLSTVLQSLAPSAASARTVAKGMYIGYICDLSIKTYNDNRTIVIVKVGHLLAAACFNLQWGIMLLTQGVRRCRLKLGMKGFRVSIYIREGCVCKYYELRTLPTSVVQMWAG